MSTTPRYKDKTLQKVYENMIMLAADRNSELYYNGAERRGAGHRCAFWDGYNGAMSMYSKESRPMTMAYVCYQAGKEYARICKARKIARPEPAPTPYFSGRP